MDEFAGSDGARLDRILAQQQNSHSQTRVVCGDTYTITPTASAQSGLVTGATIKLTDDFVSLANQFETFRITAVRFDIYDINPGNIAASAWSTFHDTTTGSYSGFPLNQVVDGADAQIVPIGTGKISFTWMAHGTEEAGFQSTTNTGTVDFGGLRYSVGAGSAATQQQKFQIIMKAVVDFRGRI